jgi:hypothetical protein
MSLSEIKEAISKLSPEELADFRAFLRERETAGAEEPLDEDSAEGRRVQRLEEEAAQNSRGTAEEKP